MSLAVATQKAESAANEAAAIEMRRRSMELASVNEATTAELVAAKAVARQEGQREACAHGRRPCSGARVQCGAQYDCTRMQ